MNPEKDKSEMKKNGFEFGDIISISGTPWCDRHVAIRDGSDKYVLWNEEWYTGRTTDGKKIGNVFDNPELMKVRIIHDCKLCGFIQKCRYDKKSLCGKTIEEIEEAQ